MELRQLVEQLSAKVELHEAEAAAFAEEAERGRDFFDSECGRKYHDGCADAIRETLDLLSMLYIPNDPEVTVPVTAPSTH
ncbi:MAG: hypothetical protein HQ518_32990 [Rhodopirellula sp.]|nr:hypothetical protein [Rhodopirellula sp.]